MNIQLKCSIGLAAKILGMPKSTLAKKLSHPTERLYASDAYAMLSADVLLTDTLDQFIKDYEWVLPEGTLIQRAGSLRKASMMSGIPVSTLREKLYGIGKSREWKVSELQRLSDVKLISGYEIHEYMRQQYMKKKSTE